MRTPLTAERTLLQVALANPATTAERWRFTGQELLASSHEQERLIEALLTLASSESGLDHEQRVDLAAISNEAHSQGLTARRVDEVIELVGLGTAARRKAGGYSLGMRQRLGIAAAMLGDPPILLMDEPFNGMDPEGIVWMRSLLRSLAEQGRAVLISSHLMSELQDVAEHIVAIGRGRVIADTTVAELLAGASADRVIVRSSAAGQVARVLTGAGGSVLTTGPDALTINGLVADQIVMLLGRSDVPFSEVSAHRATLEEAYLALTRDAVEFQGNPSDWTPR